MFDGHFWCIQTPSSHSSSAVDVSPQNCVITYTWHVCNLQRNLGELYHNSNTSIITYRCMYAFALDPLHSTLRKNMWRVGNVHARQERRQRTVCRPCSAIARENMHEWCLLQGVCWFLAPVLVSLYSAIVPANFSTQPFLQFSSKPTFIIT